MYDLYIVKRTQIYLDERQDRLLTERARQRNERKSALVREAIDAWLAPADTGHSRLARFQAALSEVAGRLPGLPSGEEYVDKIRLADAERRARIAGQRGQG